MLLVNFSTKKIKNKTIPKLIPLDFLLFAMSLYFIPKDHHTYSIMQQLIKIFYFIIIKSTETTPALRFAIESNAAWDRSKDLVG